MWYILATVTAAAVAAAAARAAVHRCRPANAVAAAAAATAVPGQRTAMWEALVSRLLRVGLVACAFLAFLTR